jgi:hypothetical protein
VAYLKIGTGTGEGRPRILIVAGMHARELAPSDAVLTFIEKLLAAYSTKKPITYKKFLDARPSPSILYKQFTIPFTPDVKQIIERTELYVVPLVNPDGRAFVQSAAGARGWRKNRRPAPSGASCPPLPAGISDDDKQWLSTDPAGVDLNRNFDIAWDFKNFYSSAFFSAVAARTVGLGVSDNPCSPGQTFHGPSPHVAEPETLNVQELITTNKINFYMDVHSAAGKLLYAWGMAGNQSTAPSLTFKNTDLDQPTGSGRDPSASTNPYKEWLPSSTDAAHQTLGDSIRDAILDSTGYTGADEASTDAAKAQIAKAARKNSLYTAVQSIFLFSPSSPDFETGVSRDFAFSQQIGTNAGTPITAKALDPVFSYTFECGRKEDGFFQPDAVKEYPKVEREVAMGLAKFLSFAATWVAPVPPPPPPAPPPTPPEPGLIPDCFVATACYGSPLHPAVTFLCDLRDREVKATEFGRRLMHPVERFYYSFSPRVAVYLRRHEFMRIAVRLLVVGPTIHLIRRCATAVRAIRPQERRVRWLLVSIVGAGLGVLSIGAAVLALVARALVTR